MTPYNPIIVGTRLDSVHILAMKSNRKFIPLNVRNFWPALYTHEIQPLHIRPIEPIASESVVKKP